MLDDFAKQSGYSSLEALLRSPKTAQAGPTPARSAHVRALVAAGLLDEDASVRLLVSGSVPDVAWRALGPVTPGRGPAQKLPQPEAATAQHVRTGPRTVASWSVTLHDRSETRTLAVDPLRWPQRALPIGVVLSALDALDGEGWTVLALSEDRAIDDTASVSRVVRQRYLLRRA